MFCKHSSFLNFKEIKYWNDYKNNPLNAEMLIENNIKISKIPNN